MEKSRIDIISMGCSKNLVDSERLVRQLEEKGYKVVHNADEPSGDYVVVNTCGFIGDAKEESINLILNLTRLKQENKIGKIVVMGCLSERYRRELPVEIPEVDIWYGKFDWKDFITRLPSLKQYSIVKDWERTLSTPPWSAYLKVSEGCDRRCAYCAIPMITGRQKSRRIEEILEEVKKLVSEGVKEFNVIAQDLSSYGRDIYGESRLPELIEEIARISGVEWIRLHYLYPSGFPMGILDVMNKYDNICKYMDIALQHISDKVLQPMNRKINKEETLNLIKEIRRAVPGIHLRTTIMTGFPGEDEAAFEELKEFVAETRFERLGGFAYCEEEDTLAAKTLKDLIPTKIKEERLSEIMEIQQRISEGINLDNIGKKFKVLVEKKEGKNVVGRTQYDSPEVDQEIIIENCDALPGTFITVEVTDAYPFEMIGKEIRN